MKRSSFENWYAGQTEATTGTEGLDPELLAKVLANPEPGEPGNGSASDNACQKSEITDREQSLIHAWHLLWKVLFT